MYNYYQNTKSFKLLINKITYVYKVPFIIIAIEYKSPLNLNYNPIFQGTMVSFIEMEMNFFSFSITIR